MCLCAPEIDCCASASRRWSARLAFVPLGALEALAHTGALKMAAIKRALIFGLQASESRPAGRPASEILADADGASELQLAELYCNFYCPQKCCAHDRQVAPRGACGAGGGGESRADAQSFPRRRQRPELSVLRRIFSRIDDAARSTWLEAASWRRRIKRLSDGQSVGVAARKRSLRFDSVGAENLSRSSYFSLNQINSGRSAAPRVARTSPPSLPLS